MIPWLAPDQPFPPVHRALREPNGLLAAGGELSTQRLLEAYRRGIFPWYSEGEPVLWWSPDPRMVLFPEEISISRSLRKRLRNVHYEVRVDTCFHEVMHACAMPREGQAGTWITDDIVSAYTALHAAGLAHSIETWIGGELAGGLYGVSIGGAFFGESMFHHVRDASKIALLGLVQHLRAQKFALLDTQWLTPHLRKFGAIEIPRYEYLHLLNSAVDLSRNFL